jgi:hypothetical protein
MNITLQADFEKKLQDMKTNINVDPALITLAMDVFAKCSRIRLGMQWNTLSL